MAKTVEELLQENNDLLRAQGRGGGAQRGGGGGDVNRGAGEVDFVTW